MPCGTILLRVAATEEHFTVAPIVGPDDPRRFTDSGIELLVGGGPH